MSVEARIKAALDVFGDPVEKSLLYASAESLPSQYYTFTCSSQGEDWADNEPGCERWLVNVHFFAPLEGNYTRRIHQTKLALHQAGFTWPRCCDAGDQDGQHVVFECETVQGLEVE